MNKPTNDFTKEENRAAAPYKMWINYKPSAFRIWKDISRNPATYYGFNSKSTTAALAKLMQTYEERELHIETAIIYGGEEGGNRPIFRELKIKDIKKW